MSESLFSGRLAALNAAANRHGSDHELSAVCSHLHAELPKLAAVVAAAERFVATTSYYRQVKASRAEFEALAVALFDAKARP